jgi:hypothetical protein
MVSGRQPVVWSEPNISQIEAWSTSIYAWYQEFEFVFVKFFRLKFNKIQKKIQIQILDTRHKLHRSKLQFDIYLVPTKPLVVPETI